MTARRLSVAVIQGGPSSEAEVSRSSAKSVAKALQEAGHAVVRLELDGFLAESLRTGAYDVVFPVTHGAVGEDGSLQGLLEVLELPYVGSGVLASALAMHKRTAKVLFRAAGLPVAPEVSARRGEIAARAVAERVLAELGPHVVVKPCESGSAIGVRRFATGSPASLLELAEAVEGVWSLDDVVLVERFAPGREVTCGVLERLGQEARALPPTEIRASKDAFYTYEARYAPGRSEHACPAPIGEALTRRVQAIAVAAHRALGCRDLCRADFVVATDAATAAEDAVTLLEVNTLPGFTETSLFPEAAGVTGLAMADLCSDLARAAHERGARRRNAAIPLPR